MSSVSISTNNLTIGYRRTASGGNAAGNVIIQRDLTFALREGEMVCMLGPNGCGKSTLLRTLAGLQPALGGEFVINQPSNLQPFKQGAAAQTPKPSNSGSAAHTVALVLTERLSMDNTTVHDVVALGRYPYSSFLDGLKPEDEQIIAESLQQVGFLSPFTFHLSTFFNAHSDGEKQRILIAKALAQQTPVILLDEPTAHLDLPHRILVLRLLRRLAHEQGKTILISTHELDLALALSDRILLMTPGRGVQLDTAENLKKSDAFTAAFGMDIFNPLG
ncbi:MAG: ABC transporter ATP-binding protein [Paludibacteraceae bacterium]|nr:ABC transporter ATP-binding protein [Paludibacteraceae bacterium]